MNSNVSQEGQGCCGVSVLGDFHIVQSPGFNPRIASLDAIADLALKQE